jgi:hypothetical protein
MRRRFACKPNCLAFAVCSLLALNALGATCGTCHSGCFLYYEWIRVGQDGTTDDQLLWAYSSQVAYDTEDCVSGDSLKGYAGHGGVAEATTMIAYTQYLNGYAQQCSGDGVTSSLVPGGITEESIFQGTNIVARSDGCVGTGSP